MICVPKTHLIRKRKMPAAIALASNKNETQVFTQKNIYHTKQKSPAAIALASTNEKYKLINLYTKHLFSLEQKKMPAAIALASIKTKKTFNRTKKNARRIGQGLIKTILKQKIYSQCQGMVVGTGGGRGRGGRGGVQERMERTKKQKQTQKQQNKFKNKYAAVNADTPSVGSFPND